MITYVPDYYPSFGCIADRCRHSCCIGWEIDIDPDTLARYRKTGGAIGERLAANIEVNGDGASFCLDKDERCLFLNANGLCDLIIELGEDSLCEICAEHPRFRNFCKSRTELGLGLCCERAAELILTHEEKTALVALSDDGEPNELTPEEAEFFAFRDHLIAFLQDRTRPINERFGRILAIVGISPDAVFSDDRRWAEVYQTLEQLDPAWGERLEARRTCGRPIAQLPDTPEIECALEQLALYFIYRHLTESLDDGRRAERIAFALLSTHMVAMLAALEVAKGSEPLAALLDIARCYSAEIEYSTENAEILLEELEKCIK